MAEFHFYCSSTESELLAQSIISKFHLRVSPNLNFEGKLPVSYHVFSEELKTALVVNPVLYLAADFTVWPPVMIELEKGKYAGSRVIDLDRSPGLLKITFPNVKSVSGGDRFLPSSLYIPSKYILEGGFVAPSEATRKLYREMVKFIKSVLNKEKSGAWMGNEVRRILECRSGLILKDGKWTGMNKDDEPK